MDHFVTLLPPAESEANRVEYQPTNIEAEANKQRRKVQNRKNQRAHRLRNKKQDPVSVQTSRPFQIERWRLDEVEESPSHSTEPTAQDVTINASISIPDRSVVLRTPPPYTPGQAPTTLTPPSMVFPLSTDHLLHLVQYNVFRAFVSNKRTLNALLTGWTYEMPPSPTTCPISLPYIDDTNIYPLNPNIPPSLFPTRIQQERLHSFWINLFPFPSVRDNLIRHEGLFDHWELLQDLIGELMGATPMQERRGTPLAITVSDPKVVSTPPTAVVGRDEDEVTAGRKGLIVWGEPYDMKSWEATPGFLAKWSWAVQGCDDLLVSSNRWRLMRGEEPLRIPLMEN
ncbi:uncharacterized protein J4E78_004638 [Alternaria triticimaculans]|uniref:uncharacterized protein n=1 Tax=Alternaria triticimaculans TaxID=297637 RepID=UPI0020C1CC25|nr:uncharacterized protein J4E78_004638 [Alternaria triticimaculans]KAI4661848.1 hypothetical protein J4E78_004638 [Alternaria triticimaculans]